MLLPFLTGCATIYDAAHDGHVAKLETYLKKGGDANARDEHNRTLLMLAALGSHPELVKLLVDKGADVNASDGSRTPLMFALLGNPTADDAKTLKVAQTTMTFSGSGRDLDVIRVLIDKGADVNAKEKGPYGGGKTPLMQELGHRFTQGDNKLDRVRLLLDKGADVNAHDMFGETPLLMALSRFEVELYTPELVKCLVDKGADVNVKDKKGQTPLIRAVRLHWREMQGRGFTLDVVKLLVAKGADVNAKDNSGNTPLICANALISLKDVAAFLREHGAKQ